MKSWNLKLLSLVLTFIIIFSFSGCALFAPNNYKNSIDIDKNYPNDIVPIYDDVIVYDYKEDKNSISLIAGSTDDIDDISDFYMDYFEDEEIKLTIQKDRKKEYIAEGYSGKYEFELIVGTPSGKWEEKLYATVIEIEIDIINIENKKALEEYIKSVLNDLDVITQILLDEALLDSETLEDNIEDTIGAIDELLNTTAAQLDEINNRNAPTHPEFRKFHESEIALFELMHEIFLEYKQIVEYGVALLEIGNKMDSLSFIDSDDIYDIYTAMDEAFKDSVLYLKSIEVPSFLESMNNGFIDIFDQMGPALDYLVYSLDIYDYVRMDAGEYSIDILMRELDKIVIASEQDMLDREIKLDDDIAYIEEIKEGFINWIDEATASIKANADIINPLPENLILSNQQTQISSSYIVPEFIIPANYRSLDYIAFVQCWTNKGAASAKITVEIPGFTQIFEQKVDLTRAETEIIIHPPLVDNASENLNSSKDAQLVITIEDLTSGELVVQDTIDIKIYSRYDMQWWSEDGTPYIENILAWVTPEVPEIKQLLRNSADSANFLTGGVLDSIVGYQYVSDWDEFTVTYAQVASMMHAMATTMNVKYIAAPFSTTGTDLQRVATPAEVLNNAGGLCCETAVTIASAIQATGMHPVLILLPGHMQTAVETWYGSGEYILIETTALTDAANENFDEYLRYMTPDEWADYVAQDGVTVIDCDLANQFGIHSID